jgi:hypothetical protein
MCGRNLGSNPNAPTFFMISYYMFLYTDGVQEMFDWQNSYLARCFIGGEVLRSIGLGVDIGGIVSNVNRGILTHGSAPPSGIIDDYTILGMRLK